MSTSATLYPDTFLARPAKPQRHRRKNPRLVTMPDRGVSPHVKLVFAEMARLGFTYDAVEEGSGVRRPTVKQWRRKNRPSLESLEAVLGFLGWDFVPIPALETLSPELAGELTTLALKLQKSMPETVSALIDIGVEQKLLRTSAEEKRAVLAEREARNPRQPANDNTPRRRRKPA
jgi:hypothetical protein